MTLKCIKTGCHAYIVPCGEYVYGDAYLGDDTLLIRCCERSPRPINGMDVIHFTVHNAYTWFDKHRTSKGNNSTLVVQGENTQWVYHGCDGATFVNREDVLAHQFVVQAMWPEGAAPDALDDNNHISVATAKRAVIEALRHGKS